MIIVQQNIILNKVARKPGVERASPCLKCVENWVIYKNTSFAIFCAVVFSTSVPKKSSNCKILTGQFQGGRYKGQNRVGPK